MTAKLRGLKQPTLFVVSLQAACVVLCSGLALSLFCRAGDFSEGRAGLGGPGWDAVDPLHEVSLPPARWPRLVLGGNTSKGDGGCVQAT